MLFIKFTSSIYSASDILLQIQNMCESLETNILLHALVEFALRSLFGHFKYLML
jgi:hypothetical protein